MKTIRNIVFVVVLLLFAIAVYAQQYPKPTGYVNDFAQLLTQEQGTSLNDELVAFEKKTTIEIAVVTVPWLNNQSIEVYTRGLADEWGVGKRGQNNGVVFLIAPKERKMRIETASGVRSILTDSRADRIRDNTILPRFKAGNMAQGIIDGTHAIMQTFDKDFSPINSGSRATSAPQSTPREWTVDDAKVFIYVLSGMIGVTLLLFLIVPPIRRLKARNYVLENKGEFVARLKKAESRAANPDVKKETRQKLAKLKDDFFSISRLNITDKSVNWVEIREKLCSFNYPLNNIISDIESDIAFTERARREGPELIKKIPGMIEAAEKKLAEGKQSPKAVKYLNEARAQYAEAQRQQSGMSVVDWVILYMILSSVQSNCANAESAHAYANGDYSHASRSSSESSSSYGFGHSGGFGGGGGFSGGGSSGGW